MYNELQTMQLLIRNNNAKKLHTGDIQQLIQQLIHNGGRGCWQPPPPQRYVFPRRRSRVQRFDASTGTGTAARAPTAAS